MAESKTIDQLPRKATVAGSDIFPIDDGVQSYGLLFSVLLAAIPGLTGAALTQDQTGIVFTFRDGSTKTLTTHDSTKQDTLTFDNVPTQGSTNPVKSGGVYNSVSAVESALSEETQRATGAEGSIATAAQNAANAASAAQTSANNAANAASAAQSTANAANTAAGNAATAVTNEKTRAQMAEAANASALQAYKDLLGLSVDEEGYICQTI